jgi:hypothetical protein
LRTALLFAPGWLIVVQLVYGLAKLPACRVERVAVAVVGRHPKHRHTAIVFDPAQLPVRGDIAENQKSPDCIPRRAFQPEDPLTVGLGAL